MHNLILIMQKHKMQTLEAFEAVYPKLDTKSKDDVKASSVPKIGKGR